MCRHRRTPSHSTQRWPSSRVSRIAVRDCVEVAHAPGAVHVRDSKQCDGPRFEVAPSAWADFLGLVV
ncbi:DUF397 domain-containing protein [Streptomyces sp. NPDC056821]|uniref:DUF397 domain-containing protein n=1 Tax=unclassified Streptomyces TaxID=2593676 RepID=UPI0036B94C72